MQKDLPNYEKIPTFNRLRIIFILFFWVFKKKGYFIGVKINKTQKPGVYNSN